MSEGKSILKITFGKQKHLSEIVDIFNYYIANSNARFETEPMTLENKQLWFSQFQPDSRYQLFVAVEDQTVLGFACSQPYRALEAFNKTVEVSIYLAPSMKHTGVGSALYQHLFSELASQDVHSALSGIALPNEASIGLHKKFGFCEVGIFREYASKNGQYISSVWLEKLFE
ncbi:GNAT family N-acetyltransferase [Xenorhabdus sp. PB30.3]|uniref:GNAT family N-acetyltransferase n=1 Tax=Xenorhabdus sp. PB30.3 TaxID=2788941 RepID=UPI001E513E8D|nr:GNAT family N-acetyltransferase [Xenorhabdus sp. PB30.3]MCC8381009.1 N-acetyltransferase [Xenorhabdus sp. PB30.3]